MPQSREPHRDMGWVLLGLDSGLTRPGSALAAGTTDLQAYSPEARAGTTERRIKGRVNFPAGHKKAQVHFFT